MTSRIQMDTKEHMYYTIYRYPLSFPTGSAISELADVLGAGVEFTARYTYTADLNSYNRFDNPYGVVITDFTGSESWGGASYNAIRNESLTKVLWTNGTYNMIPSGTIVFFPGNDLLTTNISRTGNTTIVVRSEADRTNTRPKWSGGVGATTGRSYSWSAYGVGDPRLPRLLVAINAQPDSDFENQTWSPRSGIAPLLLFFHLRTGASRKLHQ